MREPLQNIQLIRDSLALYTKFFAPFTLLAIVPLSLEVFMSWTLFSDLLTVDPSQMEEDALSAHFADIIRMVLVMFPISLVTSAITSAMISLAVVDSRQGRPLNLSFYVTRGLSRLPLIVLLSLVTSIMVVFGLLFLLLPGLYLAAAFWVLIPLLVIERRGGNTLGRCWTLTKGYRWHILGLLLVTGLAMILISLVIDLILVITLMGDATNLWAAAVVEILIWAPLTAILLILTTNIYLRLREIKEGVTAEQITPA